MNLAVHSNARPTAKPQQRGTTAERSQFTTTQMENMENRAGELAVAPALTTTHTHTHTHAPVYKDCDIIFLQIKINYFLYIVLLKRECLGKGCAGQIWHKLGVTMLNREQSKILILNIICSTLFGLSLLM